MTKEDTLVLKGVAILMMLFYHLFDDMANVSLCSPDYMIMGESCLYLLSRAAYPVPFFLFISGYGLYAQSRKKSLSNVYIARRTIKLLINYWFILSFFLILGSFLKPWKYPHSILDIVLNYSTIKTTYNTEYWFLFPYILLTLLIRPLIRIYDRFKCIHVIIGSCLLYFSSSYVISRYGEAYIYHHWLIYYPLLCLHLLLAFTLGALSAKYDWMKKNISWRYFLFLILLIIFKSQIPSSAFDPIYAFLFFWLFFRTPLSLMCKTVLAFFGSHATNMWLIHSWFCFHLFHDFIYGFENPLVVYIVLLAISVCCSYLFMYLLTQIYAFLKL